MTALLRWANNSHELETHDVYIGRDRPNQPRASNWIPLNDSQISLRHARVSLDMSNRGYTITDLNPVGSIYKTFIIRSNRDGTYENPQELLHNRAYPLNPGDIIRIGQTPFRYDVAFPQPVQSSAQTSNSGGGSWLVGFIVVILIIAGIAYSSQNNSASSQNTPTSTPEKTLSNYCAALKSNDYNAAYFQLASTVKSKESEAQFAATEKQNFNNQGGLINCVVGITQVQNSLTTGHLTYTFKKGPKLSRTEQLVKENSTWKINSLNP